MMQSRPLNRVQQRVAADELALGLIVRLARSADIALVARASDHDFVFVDTQHALMDATEVAGIINGALAHGVAPIVRVRSCDDPSIPLYLDAGALGIIVPNVDRAEQARRAVRASKFPPVGYRSHPGPLRLFDYGDVPSAEAMAAINGATLVICMIESREGVQNAEAIAAVVGVDALHVGCVDLHADWGCSLGDPTVTAAITGVIAAARRHRRIAGVGGDRDPDRIAGYIAAGARLLTTHIDLSLLMAEAARATAGLRGLRSRTRD